MPTKKSTKSVKSKQPVKTTLKADKLSIFAKFSHFFFKRGLISVALWLLLVVVSFLVYSNVIKKDGFPPLQLPTSIISGYSASFHDDTTFTDDQIVQPILEQINGVEGIETTTATSDINNFEITVEFENHIEPHSGTQALQQAIERNPDLLPANTKLNYTTFDPSKILFKYDILLALYSENPDVSAATLQADANKVSQQLMKSSQIEFASPENLLTTGINPVTQLEESRPVALNELGRIDDASNQLNFYPSILIGVAKVQDSDLDTLGFSEYLDQQIDSLDLTVIDSSLGLESVFDWADIVNEQVDSLESNMFTALVAVVIISFILISWRASIITALFIVTTVLVSIAIMYLVGLSLNIITLFALILALGLFVDDATIIVEVIDAQRRKNRKLSAGQIIKQAVQRVGSASFAGTITTILVFVPMLFLTGTIGEIIKVLPLTVIVALTTSFVLSLILIPVLSKYLILKQKQDDLLARINPILKLETFIANFLASKITKLPKPGFVSKIFPLTMVLISIVMVISSGIFFRSLEVDIFTESKDSNNLYYEVEFPENYTLDQAQTTLDQINQTIKVSLTNNVTQVTYIMANNSQAAAYINLTPYQDRQVTAPQLSEQLKANLKQKIANNQVKIQIGQDGGGPPEEEFPVKVQVFTDDQATAETMITQLDDYLRKAVFSRTNGQTTGRIIETQIPNYNQITRIDTDRVFMLGLQFDIALLDSLIEPTQDYINNKFDEDYLATYDLKAEHLKVDAGSISEDIESFQSLQYTFPLALLLMYVLLVVQFKSFMQPLLMLLAIPFTFFGISVGLVITDNSMGFFVFLGIVSLIGISVNNTILFTDYTNQEIRRGSRLSQAVAQATRDRFRPLLATSLTTIVALLPLALSDPFWQALSWTIIFGLISSTFLVIIAFPYYYLVLQHLLNKLKRYRQKSAS